MEHIAAWTALVIAITGLIGTIGGLIRILREVNKVHQIVNSNNERLENKVAEFRKLLTESLEREARRQGAEQERQSPS